MTASSNVNLARPLDLDERTTLPLRVTGAPVERPEPPGERRAAPTFAPFPVIAGYEFARPLGRGGMGVVYLAREIALNRWVAVKVLVGGTFAGDEALDRFRREAEAVAALQHPNIVQIFQVGTSQFGPDGQPACPFIALEYADGGTLAAHTGKPADPSVAAELVATLADAVHYAHGRGIVHRDLKPGNVLMRVHAKCELSVDSLHGMLTPKISDFGLAKRVGVDGPAASATVDGSMLGTPEYMAPEQANGRSDVGPPADVYALGVILYELLTGRVPLQGADYVDTLLRVRSQEPISASRLQPRLPRDLDTICEHCLRKEPDRRYASAAALAADLRAWRDGRPIAARPIGPLERAWKWTRRRPSIAALLASVVTVTAIGVVGVLTQWQKAERRAVAESAARAQTNQALDAVESSLYFGRINLAQRELAAGNRRDAERILDACRPASGARDLRGWEWHYLTNACRAEQLAFRASNEWVWDLAYSPDGATIATAAGSPYDGEREKMPGELRLWDAKSGALRKRFDSPSGTVRRVVFSPDGQCLCTASFDGHLRLWDVATGQLLGAPMPVKVDIKPDPDNFGDCGPCWFTPDGQAVEFRGPDVWQRLDRATGAVTPLPDWNGTVHRSPDGRLRLARRGPSDLDIVDVATGSVRDRFHHAREFHRAALSPNGTRVATSDYGCAEVFALRPRRRDSIFDSESWIEAIAFRGDGHVVAWAGSARQVVVRDLATGATTAYIGHDAEVRALAWSPDGRSLASCDRGGHVLVWDVTRNPQHQLILPGLDASNQFAVGLWSDGSAVIIAQFDNRFFRYDRTGTRVVDGQVPGLTRKVEYPRMDVRVSADGAFLFGPLEADRRTVGQWDTVAGAKVREFRGHTLPIVSIALSQDGRRLATRALRRQGSSVQSEAWVWDTQTGEKLHEVTTAPVSAMALSSDGRRLAGFLRTGAIAVWDVAAGHELWRTAAHTAAGGAPTSSLVFDLAFSPDDHLLASAGFIDGCVQLWDARTGDKIHAPLPARPTLTGVTFTPDGRRIAAAGYDSEVRLWDVATGQLALTLTVPGGARRADLAFTARPFFSQRNGRLAVLNWNGSIAVWDGLER